MAYIYKITNPKGKVYIGSTINLKKRWNQYYKMYNPEKQPKIFNSLKKYGVKNHLFEIITECDILEMLKLESVYGHMYDVLGKNGLNLALPKDGDIYRTLSKEACEKRSILSKTEKNKQIMLAHPNNTETLNMETGIFYETAKEAYEVHPAINRRWKKKYFWNMLQGCKRNQTQFIYTKDIKLIPERLSKQMEKPKGGKRATFNTELGIFYDSGIEAFKSIKQSVDYKYFRRMLLGTRPNKTQFIYI